MSNLAITFAEKLLNVKCVKVQPEQPFTWASGIKSPIYCDNRLVLSAPQARTVVENAIASIPGTKFRSQGPLLITHWGMSGPAILKLSSYAARHLAEGGYQSPLLVNWTGETNAEVVRMQVVEAMNNGGQKLIDNVRLFGLQTRLWQYLLSKAQLQGKKCSEVGKKGINRLADLLTNDNYSIAGRSHYKDEFVTCGGVSLSDVDKASLESKHHPNLFYAGEVLDIDGITGGFNFQAAWTTAYAVACGIVAKINIV